LPYGGEKLEPPTRTEFGSRAITCKKKGHPKKGKKGG